MIWTILRTPNQQSIPLFQPFTKTNRMQGLNLKTKSCLIACQLGLSRPNFSVRHPPFFSSRIISKQQLVAKGFCGGVCLMGFFFSWLVGFWFGFVEGDGESAVTGTNTIEIISTYLIIDFLFCLSSQKQK